MNRKLSLLIKFFKNFFYSYDETYTGKFKSFNEAKRHSKDISDYLNTDLENENSKKYTNSQRLLLKKYRTALSLLSAIIVLSLIAD